jgi:hypothetical protein
MEARRSSPVEGCVTASGRFSMERRRGVDLLDEPDALNAPWGPTPSYFRSRRR